MVSDIFSTKNKIDNDATYMTRHRNRALMACDCWRCVRSALNTQFHTALKHTQIRNLSDSEVAVDFYRKPSHRLLLSTTMDQSQLAQVEALATALYQGRSNVERAEAQQQLLVLQVMNAQTTLFLETL